MSKKMTHCAIFDVFYNYELVAIKFDVQHLDTLDIAILVSND